MTAQLVTGIATLEPGTDVVFSFVVPQGIRDLGSPNPYLSWAETVDPVDSVKFKVTRNGITDPRATFTVANPTTHEGTLGAGRLQFRYNLTGVDPLDVYFVFAFGVSPLDGSSANYTYDPTIVVE